MRKKRKALAVWKVILITIASIIGLIGVTVLALWIRGDFNDNPVYPESGIFFVTDGNEKYNSDLHVIETSENFSLTLSTTTEEVNRKTVNLTLPNGVRENGYIDNGIIRVPEVVQLDSAFTVQLSTSPIDNHIAGGLTYITATSTYPTIDPVTISVNVDVPVQEITAFCYDAEDSNEEALSSIFVGSYFKIGVNYSPDRSGSVFGRDEEKYVFYDFTTNDIEFDYITKTFHATRVSEGTSDEIRVYVFSDSQYQKEFLASFDGDPDEFTTEVEYSEFNTAALNYMTSNDGSYKVYQISNLVVEEISVNSFVVTNQRFTGTVDKMFNVALNSTLSEFDGNLGVVIRDADDNVLNSVYGGGVGIALGSQNDNISFYGGQVLRMTIQATIRENQGAYSYEYTYNEGKLTGYTTEVLSYDEVDNFNPVLPTGQDGETVEIVYYFMLPSRNSGQVGNYNYSISSNAATNADFIVALFLENDGEYELFLAENQTFENLSKIGIEFQNSVESEIYWDEGSDILNIVYDSDSHLSDSVELSEFINVPSANVYQTVVYFLMFENGGRVSGEFSAVALGDEFLYTNGEDFNITVPGGAQAGNNVYLYELPSSSLSALQGCDETLYLLFATVRTNAEGNVVLDEGGNYDIIMLSDIKSLEIDATIPMGEIEAILSLNSGDSAEIYLDGDRILLPSVLTSEDSFTYSITIEDDAKRNQLLELFNSGDLVIEFRDSNGEKVNYIVTSNDIQIMETGLTGSIVVYESFNSVDGVVLTPYLIYDNGKQVQESAIKVVYGGERDNFTLYKQSVASAQYAFETMENITNPTDSASPINVQFNLDSTTITWPNMVDSLTLEDLNNRLAVILYDTHGKVIRTNVASYTLTEESETGNKVISIVNNEIMQFLSINGESISTSVKATYRNAGSTQSFDDLSSIYFNVQSEGVKEVEYDTSLYANDPSYAEYNLSSGNPIHIEKYLIADDFIVLDDLVHVYRASEDNTDESVLVENITFTLNQADMTGFSSDDLGYLFFISGEADGISSGMIKLGGDGATSADNIDANLVLNYTSPIISFKMVSALARDVRLVFDITDSSGLVNLKLELVLKRNIEYTSLFETYANDNGYSKYLLSGGDSVRIFGGEQLNLDNYLKISYINTWDENLQPSWSGNLGYSSDTGVVQTASNNTNIITFKDVKKTETGNATFYYKGSNQGTTVDHNPFSLAVTINFVLSPNFAYVQENDYVDLHSLNEANLSEYYALYRATDFIDYYINGVGTEAPSALNSASISYSSPQLIQIEENLLTRTEDKFSANIGSTIDVNVTLKNATDNQDDDAYALVFIHKDDTYSLYNEEDMFRNNLSFRIGYGAENGASALIDEIFGSQNSDKYSLMHTSSGGYELTLLEGTAYALGSDWTYSYAGNGIMANVSDEIHVQNLTNFNIAGTFTFVCDGDEIIVPARLTCIGLEYVKYDDDYDYDIITGSDKDLENGKVAQEFTAGDTYKVLYIGTADDASVGYHVLGKDGMSYNLSIYSVTEGYEDLVSLSKSNETLINNQPIDDQITLNSMIDIDQEVYVVLKLTLTMTQNAQQLSTDIFYRIRVLPNYTYKDDVIYPYNDAAEYVTSFDEENTFQIDFNEKFTTQNASASVVGKSRFPSMYLNDSEVQGLTYRYYVTSVIVNGETLNDYSNYIEFNNLINNNEIDDGVLVGELTDLGNSAIIEVRVTRIVEENDSKVADSEKVYRLLLNNEPNYDNATVSRDNSGSYIALSKENGNFVDDVTVGKEYSYIVTILQNEEGIQTPITSNVFAHITSDDGEDYLVPIIKEDAEIFDESGKSATPTLSVDYTIENLTEDVVVGEQTFFKEIYKILMVDGGIYYIKAEDVEYFRFTQEGSNFRLEFQTISAISEDASFSIGIYTNYINAFDIVFSIDGGYDIVYKDLSGTFISGQNYNISSFIDSVKIKGGEDVDLSDIDFSVTSITTDNKVYTDDTTDFVPTDFITIDGDEFKVARFNEDFTALITAKIGTYNFTFQVKFAKSFDNSTLRQTRSDTVYSQDSITLNIDTLKQALSVFAEREGADETLDEITFANGEDEYNFVASNVAEMTMVVLDLDMEYRFNDKVMFTFTIEYTYTVNPNVDLKINYPNPQNTTAFTTEYVDNGEEISNFFNTTPKFAGVSDTGVPDNRVLIEKFGDGSYTYDIEVFVDDMNNATLTVNNSTQIAAPGRIGITTNATGDMPNYNFKFNLENESMTGSITFSIVVNEVTDYYYVTISNNSVVTIETNPTNFVDNTYERIYVEDIAGATDNHIYSQNRMLKYAFASGAAGTYHLRFENAGGEHFVEDITVEETGIVFVEDLGKSYVGYTLQGVYSTNSDAENRLNRLTNTSTIFSTLPYLTERIVLKYNGVEVSESVASIFLQNKNSADEYTEMNAVSITDKLEENDTQNIYYQYSYSTDNLQTGSSYTTRLTVKFDVTTSVLDHYQEIVAGQELNLLNSTDFGIINTETGERYTASAITANNAFLNLEIYGFSSNPIEDNSTLYVLDADLKSGTAQIANGQKFETGLSPRYGMELNSETDIGNITQNYLVLTTQGDTLRPNNYIISAQGAGNIGNFVAMKLTYSTVVDSTTYTKSADLLFKVMPSYSVQFSAESATGGVIYGDDMTIDGVNYSTNSSNNAFRISSSSDTQTFNIYGTDEISGVDNSIIRVYRTDGSGSVTSQTNLSNKFSYTFKVGGTSGYNTYGEDSQGLSLPSPWELTDDKTYTANTNLSAERISFNINTIQLGTRYYYFDAVDNYGFNIRFYLTVNAEMNPEIVSVSDINVSEGDIIRIGSQYRVVNLDSGTVTADAGDGVSTSFSYTLAYNLTNVQNHVGDVLPIFVFIDNDSGATEEGITGNNWYRYYYSDGTSSHLTTDYSKISSNTAILYIDTNLIGDISSGVLKVQHDGKLLSPLHNDSQYYNPISASQDSGLNITLSGFDAYTFNVNVGEGEEVYIPYIAEDNGTEKSHYSNVNNIEISSITFEVDGERVGENLIAEGNGIYNSQQIDKDGKTLGSNKLITTDNMMIKEGETGGDTLEKGYVSAVENVENGIVPLKVPTLPGYLYGTSTVVDNVTMVITLTDRTNTAELRQTLNISRSKSVSLTTTEYLDTQTINKTSFTNQDGGEDFEVYNDTLEIMLDSGASVSYAIAKGDEIPTDDSYITLTNNRPYTHVEYVRISTVGEEFNAGTSYNIYMKGSKDGVTFKYGGEELTFSSNEEKATINIESIADKSLTLRVESKSELNSSNYTSRTFFTIINENGQNYHNNHTVYLYSLANSITTTTEIGVNDYYMVSGSSSAYYVIPVAAWASGLTYASGSGNNIDTGYIKDNKLTISEKPYYYSYSIKSTDAETARGASVDSMGTITTGTNFNIQSNYIEVDVVLHVAGANGLFEDVVGIELGTVRMHLNNSEEVSSTSPLEADIYSYGTALIVINDGETVTGYGSATMSGSNISSGTDETIVVPVGEEITFSDYIDASGSNSTCSNSTFRIVSEGGTYSNWDNEDVHTFSEAGEHSAVLVESYVEGGSIVYKEIKVKVIAYNENNVSTKAIAVATNSTEKTLANIFSGSGEVYLAEDVEGVFSSAMKNGTNVSGTPLYSTSPQQKTIRVVAKEEDVFNYYEVTILFYETPSDEYDVALPTRTNYNLYQLAPTEASNIYAIDNNELKLITNESIQSTLENPVAKEYYAVASDGTVTKLVVNYYIYQTEQNSSRSYWYQNSSDVTKEEVIKTIGKDISDSSYTLYQLSSTREMTEVDDIIDIDGTSSRTNINFLLFDGENYSYYTFTFYRYTSEAEVDVATNYTTSYALSNLNSLVIDEFGITDVVGTPSWYTFENGELISQTAIELMEDTADGSADNMVTKEFYVNINNIYYKLNITFYCASGTFTDRYVTSNVSIAESELSDHFKSVVGNSGSGKVYLVDSNNRMTEFTTLTLPEVVDVVSAGINQRFLYRVGTVNYIITSTILNGGSDLVDENLFTVTSSTLGANSEVNINLNSNSLKSAIASYLGISVYDLILSTSKNGTNLSAYNFAPTEPLVNYDYFLLKLYARSEEEEAKIIYILATNTISLSAENITISVAETSNDAIISALNEDFEYVNVTSSTLYAIENGRAVGMANITLGEGETSVTKQVYYIANTDGKTEHKLINLTINIESEEEGA